MGLLLTGLLGVGCGEKDKPDGVTKGASRAASQSTGEGTVSQVKKLAKRVKKALKKPKPPKKDFASAKDAEAAWGEKTNYDIEFVTPEDAQQAEAQTEAQTSQFACGTRSFIFINNALGVREGTCPFITRFDEESHAAWSIKGGRLHDSLKPQVLQVTVEALKDIKGITDAVLKKYANQSFEDLLTKAGIDITKSIDFCEVRKKEKLIGRYVSDKECKMSVGPPPDLLRDFINGKMIPGVGCALRAESFAFDDLDDAYFRYMQSVKDRGGIPIVLLFLKNKLTWHYEAIIRINQEKVFLRNTNKRWDVWSLGWLGHRGAPQHAIDKVIASAVLNGRYNGVAIFPR
ncbi:MAG: hypothetical protein AAF320_01525 [Myxococcota bacterium]